MKKLPLRAWIEAGVMIALAVILHQIKVYQAPAGGAVTAGSMVPLIYIAVRYGPGLGLLTGAAYGLIDFAFEPFFVHPVQFLLDYPLAFAVLGLAGLLRRWPAFGAAFGIALRFVCHLLSGVVFFASSAPAGQNVWVYSALYNGTYLLPELVISMFLTYFLFAALANMGRPVNDART
ncbi:MAG: energy-coupled thiamine transporter ThiT [Bacillota bacterium]